MDLNDSTFRKDDIAHDSSNPYPGTVYNGPADKHEKKPENESWLLGPNVRMDLLRKPLKCGNFDTTFSHQVYHGVPRDYTGKNFTLENLFAVLSGEATKGGSGKTLKSGPKDNIFLYYTDHGSPGSTSFVPRILFATDLNKVLPPKKT